MKKPIIKLPQGYLSVSGFAFLLDHKGIASGESFNISFKHKKRRKLKSVKLVTMFSRHCECCGNSNYITFEKDGRFYNYDNHLGNSNAGQLGADLMKEKF